MTDCKNCGGCCNHIAVEIDKPTSKNDYQQILWFLLHKNVRISIDNDNDWLIEFLTPCEWRKDEKCINHTKRPNICKAYSSEECVMNGEGEADKHLFTTYDEFMAYVKKKGIDYEFKWQKKQ